MVAKKTAKEKGRGATLFVLLTLSNRNQGLVILTLGCSLELEDN